MGDNGAENRKLPQTISLRELATIFGLSMTPAYKLAQENRLPVPAIRCGGQYRFSLAAVEALLDPNRKSGEAA